MKRNVLAAAACVTAVMSFFVIPASGAEGRAERAMIEGRYHAEGDGKQVISIVRLGGDAYRLESEQWEGIGFFDGKGYWGVFRQREKGSTSQPAGTSGTHRATRQSDGSFHVHGEFTAGRTGGFDAMWRPARTETPPALPIPRFEHPVWPPDAPPGPRTLPKFGEYVYVEELPEALTKVPPVYPEDARKAGIDGTVMVQALVGEDGLVKDTRVVRSIPALDEAAVAAVRQWVFKPARAAGKPVAVWVAVPIRFTLH